MPVASVSSLPTQRRNYVAACQADARCERSVMMPFLDGNHSRKRGDSSSRRMLAEVLLALIFAAEALRRRGSG
jgi:hypothetical protein